MNGGGPANIDPSTPADGWSASMAPADARSAGERWPAYSADRARIDSRAAFADVERHLVSDALRIASGLERGRHVEQARHVPELLANPHGLLVEQQPCWIVRRPLPKHGLTDTFVPAEVPEQRRQRCGGRRHEVDALDLEPLPPSSRPQRERRVPVEPVVPADHHGAGRRVSNPP